MTDKQTIQALRKIDSPQALLASPDGTITESSPPQDQPTTKEVTMTAAPTKPATAAKAKPQAGKAKPAAAAKPARKRGATPKSRQAKPAATAKGVASSQKQAGEDQIRLALKKAGLDETTKLSVQQRDRAMAYPAGLDGDRLAEHILVGEIKPAEAKPEVKGPGKPDLGGAQRLVENEKVKEALRKARLSVNSDLTPEQRARALKPGGRTGNALGDHIMKGTTTATKVSGKEAARKVLAAHQGPMKISELSQAAVGQATGMNGKTPEQSIARDVLMDAKKPADKRIFVKVGKGLYDLHERNPQGDAPQAAAETPAAA